MSLQEFKRSLSQDCLPRDQNLSVILQLNRSKSAYIGQITKTINRIENLKDEEGSDDNIKCLQEQLYQILEKLKSICSSIAELENQPSEIFKINELFFQQTSRVNNFNRSLEEYLSQAQPNQVCHEKTPSHKSTSSNMSHLSRRSKSTPSVVSSKTSFSSILSKERESYERTFKLLEKKKDIDLQIEKENLYSKLIKSERKMNSVSNKSKSVISKASSSLADQNLEFNKANVSKVSKVDSLEMTRRLLNSDIPRKDDINLYDNCFIDNNHSNAIDKFIDELEIGNEVKLPSNETSISVAAAVQQDLESRYLPKIPLKTFDGDSKYWPEFISNFKERVHNKRSFTNSIRM